MSGAQAWNTLLAKAWGEQAPEEWTPSNLSWARGNSVRAVAQGSAKNPLSFLAGIEEEEQDGPSEADIELRKILAEWNNEDSEEEERQAPEPGIPGLEPRMQRELGVRWLHEHMAAASGVGSAAGEGPAPSPNVDHLFAGAFRAAAREEADARPKPPPEPEPKKEEKPLQEAYILPVKEARPEAKVEEARPAARPETDFLNLLNAWSETGGQPGQPFQGGSYPSQPKKKPAPVLKKTSEAPGERRARELREAAEASPGLAKLRLRLAEDKTTTAPPEYRSFCQQMKASGGELRKFLREWKKGLAVAEVSDVPRAQAASEPLKTPVVVQAKRGWRPKAWTQAFWSYEAGEDEHRCYRRYPPTAPVDGEEDESNCSVKVRIDEFCKYSGTLKDNDPSCLEEHFLTFPRFFVGGWCPFVEGRAGFNLWKEDWKSGRQLWAPAGIVDLTHKWVKMCCACGLPFESALASFDRVQMGPPGAVSRLHVENNSAHAWYAQVQGKRAFVLFAPTEREKLYPETAYPEPCTEQVCEHSPVDVFHPNERLYPRFRESRAQVAVLDPGDTLVVPSGWWHCSVMLESGSSLVRRFWNRSNRHSVHEEFQNLVSAEELEKQHMGNVFLHHVEGCRRAIAQDDSPEEEDDARAL